MNVNRTDDIPFQMQCQIIQGSSFCDILYPCKKNSFKISNSDIEWIVTEESNYCINYCLCQFRSMQLQAKDNEIKKYVAERPKNVLCNELMMKIKYREKNKVF